MNILVWLGNKDMHPAIYPNMKSIADALAEMGHNVITCNTASYDEVKAAMVLLREEKFFKLSIGVNALGMKVMLDDGEPVDTFADLDTIHISILLDEPFNPHCNGFKHIARHHIITCLDRSDAEYFSRMKLACGKNKMFMPLGGTESGLSWDELMEQKRKTSYKVVVSAGKFIHQMKWAHWTDYGATPAISRILDDILELLQSEPVSIVVAAKKILLDRGMSEDEYFCAIASFFPAMLCYVKAWRRQQMLMKLLSCGVEIDLFGDDWEQRDFPHGVTVHGVVPYTEMLRVISKAKVVVNDEACFNNGAHDRVFTSMLNGAVVVSEYSSYLEEEFTDGQDLFMFNWKNIQTQLQIIPKLLDDDELRERIAANAYAKVCNRHTWRQRAERLVEAAELLDFQHQLQQQEI